MHHHEGPPSQYCSFRGLKRKGGDYRWRATVLKSDVRSFLFQKISFQLLSTDFQSNPGFFPVFWSLSLSRAARVIFLVSLKSPLESRVIPPNTNPPWFNFSSQSHNCHAPSQ